jgi:hypothetical protein
MQSELHDLRARLDATNQRLAAAEHELARVRQSRRRRPAGRVRLGAAAALAVLLALVPLSLFAANPFNDLVPGSVHNANIDAIYNAGITTGCVPNVSYCPTANVTRQEMASFLARTAGIGANKPVTNAARLSVSPAAVGSATFAANDLVRVARASSTALDFRPTAAPPAWEALPGAALTIQAPGNGFVLVTATVECLVTAGEAGFIRLHDTTPGAPAPALAPFVSSGFGAANEQYAISTTWIFPVTGAGAKTFVLEVSQWNATANDVDYFNGALTALFVPFGAGGAGTLGVENPPAPSGQPANP